MSLAHEVDFDFVISVVFSWMRVRLNFAANRVTGKFLDTNPSNGEIVDYLNEYRGEVPGSATYGAFVNWGLMNPDRFVVILNLPKITQKNLDLIVYMIAGYGSHSQWCQIYSDLDERENDKYIRNRLLGCNDGL